MRKKVSIIEFTIVDANSLNVLGTYQCEDGMTWEKFINSDYNTNNNFYVNDNYVHSTKRGTARLVFDEEIFFNMVIKKQTCLVDRSGLVGTKI